jgi:proline racemase
MSERWRSRYPILTGAQGFFLIRMRSSAPGEDMKLERRILVPVLAAIESQRHSVEITVPQFGTVTLDVPRAGAFYTIDEETHQCTSAFHADD